MPVNAISSKEATRFGLDQSNKGNQMMRDMGWIGGSIGKDENGIATALTGQSIGGQTTRRGLGSESGGVTKDKPEHPRDYNLCYYTKHYKDKQDKVKIKKKPFKKKKIQQQVRWSRK